MPSSFAFGHSINHHKYTNSPKDVVTTADFPRDSFLNFVPYITRFGLYALNISTVIEFWSDKNYSYVFKMIAGSAYYWTFFAVMLKISPIFAVAYVGYPLLENVLILACINWCWHAFVDPEDPDNDFAASITILEGKVNVLNEDYHVVHHQYPAQHWSLNPELYAKHLPEYPSNKATMFRGTHVMELFFLIILRKYDELAEKFVDLSNKMTLKEKRELIISRLHACSWGANFNCSKHPRQEA